MKSAIHEAFKKKLPSVLGGGGAAVNFPLWETLALYFNLIHSFSLFIYTFSIWICDLYKVNLVENTDLKLIQGLVDCYKVKNRTRLTTVSDTSIGVKSVKTLDKGEAELRVGAERW